MLLLLCRPPPGFQNRVAEQPKFLNHPPPTRESGTAWANPQTRVALVGFRGVGSASCDQGGDERAKQGFAATACVVHELEEPQIERQLLLRDPPVRAEPGAQQGQRHRHQEFIRFLNAIEAALPAGRIVNVILDNYATHKHPTVLAWLSRHPRFVFHFTPTACSWLNAVETFFAALTKRQLRRGVFCSIVDLQAAIHRYIAEPNAEPKPFVWTADPDRVLAAINRGNQALESVH